ncbi:ribonuclease inhibitor-like [Cyprinus carpio]|uniref:Ribonuclease inhibitor-like n=1 Tax=Cyprinus carpio TaxID=7962 RepID=A0A9Q9ZRT4_CYPCA|nr:ribonuclease inhibitor-like [Cyprinus carpio]
MTLTTAPSRRFLKSPAAEEACDYLTTFLGKNPLLLKELDLSRIELGVLGGEKLSALLMDSHSKVEKIKLSDCSITEEGYKALASALKSNPSHLIELDLTGNDPGQSGVKQLSDLQKGWWNSLKTTLRFLGPAAEEACKYVTGIVGTNPLLLRELNLSEHQLGDKQVNQITALLQDKHCKLDIIHLRKCGLTEKSCSALATVLKSNSSLKELDMSDNNLQDSGVKKLLDGLENTNYTLENLRLNKCNLTDRSCSALAAVLGSDTSLKRAEHEQ